MYARATRIMLQPDKLDEVTRTSEQDIVPALQSEPGFKGFYVLGNRETGESLVLTMWDSPEAEEATRPKVAQRFGMLKEYLAGEPEPSMIYEVVQSAMPAETTPA